jgi:hypothetical protein
MYQFLYDFTHAAPTGKLTVNVFAILTIDLILWIVTICLMAKEVRSGRHVVPAFAMTLLVWQPIAFMISIVGAIGNMGLHHGGPKPTLLQLMIDFWAIYGIWIVGPIVWIAILCTYTFSAAMKRIGNRSNR